MPVPRQFALIRTQDQWLRASHTNTALEGEVVQLYWLDDKAEGPVDPNVFSKGGGLAFDGNCRLYHSVTEAGRVERLLWANLDPLRPSTQPDPVNLFEAVSEEDLGEFVLADEKPTALIEPRGLAVDQDDRLFIAESGARRILIYDLWSNRLLRVAKLAAEPMALAADGRRVYALLAAPPGLVTLDARNDPQPLTLPSEITDPARIALCRHGEVFILEHAGAAQARVVKFKQPDEVIDVPFATDLEFQTGDPMTASSCAGDNCVLVVARGPGQDFLRFCIGENEPAELPPLTARKYDGRGIVRVPDGRIGFWTNNGFRHAVAARLAYLTAGDVTTFRLDSGEFHTTWGRIFLDACKPKDTDIVIRCITADEPPDEPAPLPSPPNNTQAEPPHKDLSPPMPPPTLAEQLKNATGQSLHRRETGPELPWVRPAEGDAFETYEAPVLAGAGRYLWVRIELSGNTRATPRVKALRAEYPSHDYLRRIPQTFSRNENVASFLRRYLAIFEGMLGELEAKADTRATLLDPRSAPNEILPWLASFLGLTLDERMARAPRPGGQSADVRRTLISEATWLFRFRGTVAGLRRFIEIYLGAEVILLEKFRTRGLGGALLDDSAAGLTSNSIIGAGLRVGGAVGKDATELITGSIEDAFDTHAHRFAVIIPAVLSAEQQDVVGQILELHRPAHTLVQVCTVGSGMRVGRGLQVALTSIIGRGAGFTQLQLGNALLGREAILGKPESGTLIGSGRVGKDSRIG